MNCGKVIPRGVAPIDYRGATVCSKCHELLSLPKPPPLPKPGETTTARPSRRWSIAMLAIGVATTACLAIPLLRSAEPAPMSNAAPSATVQSVESLRARLTPALQAPAPPPPPPVPVAPPHGADIRPGTSAIISVDTVAAKEWFAVRELFRAMEIKDQVGINKLYDKGFVDNVKSGTKVLVIEHHHDGSSEVRALDGRLRDEKFWVYTVTLEQ